MSIVFDDNFSERWKIFMERIIKETEEQMNYVPNTEQNDDDSDDEQPCQLIEIDDSSTDLKDDDDYSDD